MAVATRLEWGTIATGLALGAAPLVVVFGPLAMAPLLILAGLLSIFGLWRQHARPNVREPLMVALAVFLLWGIASTAWAPDQKQALLGSTKMVANAVLGLALLAAANRAPTHRLGTLMLVAGGVVVATLTAEYSTKLSISYWLNSLHDNYGHQGKSALNRGVAVLAFLCWPMLGLIGARYGSRAALLSLAAVAVPILISDNLTAKIALAAGGTIAGATMLSPALTLGALRVIFIGLVFAAPVLVTQLPPPQVMFEQWPQLPTSMHHRLTIWQFTAERAAEHPLIGWGFDAARVIPGGEDELTLTRPHPRNSELTQTIVEQQMPLHPHNAALHVRMELGLVGVALLSVVLWLLLGQCCRLDVPRTARPVAMATMTSAFIVANMSFGFWQSWWQASLWVAAAGCAAVASRNAAPWSRNE